MKIANIRNRVTLQKNNVTADDLGNQVETWTDFQTVWAAIASFSGREYYAASKVNAEASIKFLIRYFPDVTPDMRILFGNRVFDMVSVIDVDGRKRILELLCKEKVTREG